MPKYIKITMILFAVLFILTMVTAMIIATTTEPDLRGAKAIFHETDTVIITRKLRYEKHYSIMYKDKIGVWHYDTVKEWELKLIKK